MERTRSMRTTMHTLLAAAAAFTLTASTPAITTIEANLAQIVQYTDQAFVGTVTASEVVQLDNGRWAERITVPVSEGVLGDADAGEAVTWHQARPNQYAAYCGMPQFQVGQDYLVFLGASAPGSQFTAPVALGQGAFVVTTNENGVQVARNGYGNGNLFNGVDVQALSSAAAAPIDATTVDGIAAAAQALESSGNPQAFSTAPGEGLSIDGN